jgi:hypothetical protein
VKTSYLELGLVAANLIIWLAPAAISLKRRAFSLLHPAIIIPFLVVLSVMVAMSERWFNWTGRGDMPGIRITTRYFNQEPDFFIMPLFILALAGMAYMAGVRIGCGRVAPTSTDRLPLLRQLPFVPGKMGAQLVPVCVLAAVICMAPYLVFGQGYEFFWAGALLYAFNFIPAMVYRQNARWGLVFLVLGLSAVGLRGAKGDFIYYFLPLLMLFQGSLFVIRRKHLLRRLLLIALIGVALVGGTIRMLEERDFWTEDDTGVSFVQKILVREYGFEVFGIVVHESSLWGNAFSESPYGSWTLQEAKEAIPSFLGIEKIRMGQEVAREFMPLDSAYLPDAGFYRFFLFPFYYDFGWIGAVGGAFGIGALLGLGYRLALSRSLRLGLSWPLFVYLPVPVYSELLLNGAYSYAIIHIGAAMAMTLLIAKLTMSGIFDASPWARRQPEAAS